MGPIDRADFQHFTQNKEALEVLQGFREMSKMIGLV